MSAGAVSRMRSYAQSRTCEIPGQGDGPERHQLVENRRDGKMRRYF